MTLRRLAFAAALVLWACGGDTLVGAGGKCGGGARCEEGTRCFGGECRPELGTECDERVAQCLPGGACQGGACKGEGGSRCGDGVACALGFSCEESECVAGADGACGDGVGVRCASGLVCAQGRCRVGEGGACDGLTLSCVEPLVCSGGACVFRPGAACSREGTCAEGYECVSGTCRGESGSACSDEVQCTHGFVCEVGFCRGITGAACVATSNCAEGWACEDGRCLGGAGVECVASTECLTTFVCHAGRCAGGPGAICDAEAPCAPGGVCEQGVCRVPRGGECGDGQACADGLTCVDRRCRGDVGVACLTTSDCATGLTCELEVCRSPNGGLCDGDDDCLTGLTCENERCRGDLGTACDATATCATGLSCDDSVCLVNVGGGCDTGGECAFGNVCEAQACVVPNGGACVATTGCAATLTCEENVCVGTPGSGCEPGLCGAALVCVDGTCRSHGGGGCGETAECLAGFTCEDHVCRAGPAGDCSSTVPCRAPLACENGTCRVPALAECASDAECPSGYDCSEGTCRGVAGTGCAGDATCAVGLSCVADACIPTLTFELSGTVAENAPDELVFTMSAPAQAAVTIPYTVAGTASDADHAVRAGSVVIPLGQTRAVVALAPTDDPTDEPDETIVLSMGEVANVVLGSERTSTWTITDDDAPPVVGFTAGAKEVPENTPDSVTVAVELSAASAFTVTVRLAPGVGTATNDVDYRRTGAETTLTFAPGETRKEIGLTLVNDNFSEGPETLEFALSAPDHATLGEAAHTVTIDDDEPMPTVQFITTSTTVAEGATIQVEARADVVIQNPIAVRYAITGTARPGADYTALTGTATIGAQQQSVLLTVRTTQDTLDEDDETVVLALEGVAPGSLGERTTHTVRITDNDAPPEVNFSTYVPTYPENAGSGQVAIELSVASGREVTASWASSGAQASDHTLERRGTVRFAEGETRALLRFDLVDDTEVESDERINLALTGATNATVGALGYSYVGIEDDDAGRFRNVTDVAVAGTRSCALVDGEVRCWTDDVPRPVPGLTANVSSLCLGESYGCATAGGAVYCWGAAPHQNFNLASAVVVPGLEFDAVDVECGSRHACALQWDEARQQNLLKCWGANNTYQLGDGTTNQSPAPKEVVGLTGTVRSFSAGTSHTCAVVDGAVWCWGENTLWQVGPDAASQQRTPAVTIASGATQVSAGPQHTCAVVNGAAWCWGSRDSQRRGTVTLTEKPWSPAVVLGMESGVTQVVAGVTATCARVNGGARCVGVRIVDDKETNGATTATLPWNDPDLESGVTALAVGHHACAVRDTRAKCWGLGRNNFGTTNINGVRASGVQPGPVEILGLSDDTVSLTTIPDGIDPGGCAGDTSGALRCYGWSRSLGLWEGQPRPPLVVATYPAAPFDVMRSPHALTAGGAVYPLQAFPATTTPIAGLERDIQRAVRVGYGTQCVLRTNGSVGCWGSSNQGALGTGVAAASAPSTATAQPLGLDAGVDMLASDGRDAACALQNGRVRCWGRDGSYEYLLPRSVSPYSGGTYDDNRPELVPYLPATGIRRIALGRTGTGPAGSQAACGMAITNEGAVWRWGCGRRPDLDPPRIPAGLESGVRNVVFAAERAFALMEDGTVRDVQPGTSSAVPGLTNVTELFVTGQGLAVRMNGRIHQLGTPGPYGWGNVPGRHDWLPKHVFELRRP